MKINKKILTAITLASSLSLVGCSNAPQTADTKFVKDVEKAIDARLDYFEAIDKGKIAYVDSNTHDREALEKELSFVEKYESEEFSDATLRKLMLDYIEGLNTQLDAIKYYDSDFGKYDDMTFEGKGMRAEAIEELVDNYGLKVDEKELKNIKDNSQVMKEHNAKEKEVEELLSSIKFEKVSEEYDWADYEAVVENTTSINFEWFDLNVKLLDADGVVIATESAYADNWAPGEKVKLDFSTMEKFDKIEWTAEYYEQD